MLETVKFNIPKQLAVRLQPLGNQIPKISELGLRGLNAAEQPGFESAAEVIC